MPRYGTLALQDLLVNNTAIQAYGEQRLFDEINVAVQGHNDLVQAMIVDIGLEVTNERIRTAGGDPATVRGRMHRVDEFGSVDVQKVTRTVTTDNYGFPLHRYQYALGFTRDYIETRSVRDVAVQAAGSMEADLDRIEYEVKNAFFNPANDMAYRDYNVDYLNIPIRRFYNADGMVIPAYRGKTFVAASHTHYLGRAGGALADADITALMNTVIEHGTVGPVELWINLADEPLIASFANFYEFDPVELVMPNGPGPGVEVPRNNPTLQTVNPPDPENRAIGRWQAVYTVRTKPWVPAGYQVVVDKGKLPLAWRVRDNGAAAADQPRGQLRTVASVENFPLRADYMEREFGVATATREAAAIMYDGGTSYVQPTIALPAV